MVFHRFFVSLPEGIIIFPISIAIKWGRSGCHIDQGAGFPWLATLDRLSRFLAPPFFGAPKRSYCNQPARKIQRRGKWWFNAGLMGFTQQNAGFNGIYPLVHFPLFLDLDHLALFAKSCFGSFRQSHSARFVSSEKVPRWSDWAFLAGCSIFHRRVGDWLHWELQEASGTVDRRFFFQSSLRSRGSPQVVIVPKDPPIFSCFQIWGFRIKPQFLGALE